MYKKSNTQFCVYGADDGKSIAQPAIVFFMLIF